MARRLLGVAGLTCLLLSTCGVVAAGAQSPWDGPPALDSTQGVLDDPRFGRALAEARAKAAAVAAWRSSRASVAQRIESRERFGRVSGEGALDLARQRFPELMTSDFAQLDLPEDDRIAGYEASNVAVVVDETGDRSLVIGTRPFAAPKGERFAPLDLSLTQEADSYVPQHSAVEVTLPMTADRMLRVGDVGVGVGTAGARPVDGSVSNNRVFYPDAMLDTDFIALATPLGAEFAWQLRSVNAPERLGLDLDVPPGATVRLTSRLLDPGAAGGQVEIVLDGRIVGTITAPVAFDADGISIPARFVFERGQLAIDVPHRTTDALYPIMVDPIVEDVWGSPDFAYHCGGGLYNLTAGRWHYQEYGTPMTALCGNADGLGNGLFVRSEPTTYYDTSHSQWVWSPPAGTYIANIWFDGLRHLAAGTYLYTGLFGQSWGAVTNHMNEFVYGDWSHIPDSPYNSWAAVFGLFMQGTYDRPHIGLAAVRGVNIRIGDLDAPAIRLTSITGGTDPNSAVTPWTRSPTTHATVEAYDGGIGVRYVAVVRDVSQQVLGGIDYGCIGHRSSPCSRLRRQGFNVNIDSGVLPEGLHSLQTRAIDAVGNPGYGPHFVQRIDRSAPVITWSGDLVDHATDWQLGPRPNFDVTVTDGSIDSSETQRSGVRRIRLLLDGVVLEDYVAPEASCDNCSRRMEWSIPIELLAGRHTVTVQAWDYLDHRADRDLTVVGPEPDHMQDQFALNCADYQVNAPIGGSWTCFGTESVPAGISTGLYEPTPEDLAEEPIETYDFPPEEPPLSSMRLNDDEDEVKSHWEWGARRAYYGHGNITIGGVIVQIRTGLRGYRSHSEVVVSPIIGGPVKPEINVECKWASSGQNCARLVRRYSPGYRVTSYAGRVMFRHRPYRAKYYTNFNVYLYSSKRPGYRFHLKLFGFLAPAIRSPVFTCDPMTTFVCTYD